MKRYADTQSTTPVISRRRIPKGYAGTRRTVAHMMQLIRAGAGDFYVRQKAIDILLAARVQPKDYAGEIRTLFEWVQQHVRYTKDPYHIEVLHSPRRMLELRAGDCDDMTVVLGALLEAVGHPIRIVLTGPDARRPRLFSHVYLEVQHRGEWIPLDATMPYPAGWSPRTPVRKVIPIDRSSTVPAAPDITPAQELYGQFTHRPADSIAKRRHARVIPPVVVQLGQLIGVIYRSDKGQQGRPRNYVHFMEDPPLLTANPAGTQLYVVGGRYRVTPHGIEG